MVTIEDQVIDEIVKEWPQLEGSHHRTKHRKLARQLLSLNQVASPAHFWIEAETTGAGLNWIRAWHLVAAPDAGDELQPFALNLSHSRLVETLNTLTRAYRLLRGGADWIMR